jgi:rare lipoprotein A
MATMVSAGIAGASAAVPSLSETGPEATAAGGQPTAVSLNGRRHVMAHRAVTFRGHVSPAGAREIVIRVGGTKLRTRSNENGGFKERWQAPHAGTYTARARVAGAPVRSNGVLVNAYRPAAASYYGPGLYGNGLACGGTLTPGKLGVANKSLPCGTHLTLRYGKRSVRVQVIDRGPFSGNREFDLTAATMAKLGFPSTGMVLTTR